jgi:hypothetical protein
MLGNERLLPPAAVVPHGEAKQQKCNRRYQIFFKIVVIFAEWNNYLRLRRVYCREKANSAENPTIHRCCRRMSDA